MERAVFPNVRGTWGSYPFESKRNKKTEREKVTNTPSHRTRTLPLAESGAGEKEAFL